GDPGPASLLLLSGPGDVSPALDRLSAAGLEATASGDTGATLDALRAGPCRAVLLTGHDRTGLLDDLETFAREVPEVPVVLIVLQEGGGPDRTAALEAGAADRLVLSGDPEAWLPEAVERAVERHGLLRELQEVRRRAVDAEARFRNTVHRGADGIVIVSREDRTLRFVNRAAEEMFGRPATDLLGRPLGFPLVEGETSEIQLTRPGGSPIVAELRVVETVWDGLPALLAYLREVTDRKRAERRARDLIREQTARREAEVAARRSRFLADASRVLAEPREPEEVLHVLARLAASVGDVCIVEVTGDGGQPHAQRVVTAREHAGPAPTDIERLSG
ncbi:MAG TPA: PAS domain S-box protein, partial [Longimicrobiales bacterium]|nr:PAS domain S-box protein [Longimicrobiales bacterium]